MPKRLGGSAKLESMARTHTETAIRTIAGIMQQKSVPPAVRIQAASMLLDRGYGKPAAALEISGKDGGAILLSDMSPAEMERRYEFSVQKVKDTLKEIESKVIEHDADEEIEDGEEETEDTPSEGDKPEDG